MDLMRMLGPIEKWISEHGSAAILRDHISLLKAQHATAETNADLRIKKLESDLKDCEMPKKDQEDQARILEDRIRILEEQLSDNRHMDLLKEQELADKLNAELSQQDDD